MIRDTVIDELIAWGEAHADIRAIVLTSTRATSAPTDKYSDYDVIVITTDVAARYEQRDWLRVFGEVVIDWWDPLERDPHTGELSTGNVVYYPGTKKIDFSLWSVTTARSMADGLNTELDAGYAVLLDKDGSIAKWPKASGKGYAIELPDCDRYRQAVTDFFIGVPYVVTAIRRGELLPAKWVLDYDMRYEYLLPMLEWYAVSIHGPHVRIGNLGKGLQKLLPTETWAALVHTYADMDPQANLAAMHAMIALFRDVATKVAAAIGCDYPQELHDRVMAHIAGL